MTRAEEQEIDRRIDLGIRAGVADALEEHRRAGRRVAIWRDGAVTSVPAADIPPCEDGGGNGGATQPPGEYRGSYPREDICFDHD